MTITGNRMTAAEAEAAGFTIDRHIYPWVAYKGARFQPDDSFPIYPEHDPQFPRGVPQAIVTATPTDLRWAHGTVFDNGAGRIEIANCSIHHADPVELADTLERLASDLRTAAGEREQAESERKLAAELGIERARAELEHGVLRTIDAVGGATG